jgi:hypothetical protein
VKVLQLETAAGADISVRKQLLSYDVSILNFVHIFDNSIENTPVNPS